MTDRDTMPCERSRAGQNSSAGTDSTAKCTERDSANHDAAPAARASEATASPERVRVRGDAGTGDTPATHATRGEGSERRECTEPVAWGVVYPNDEVAVIAFKRKDAEERATASDRVVPLYRAPTLTDAEREAIAYFAVIDGPQYLLAANEAATTLRVLLERLGGRWCGQRHA